MTREQNVREHGRDQAQSLRDIVRRGKREVKIVTVTSGKGGVGKSTITVNLAIALSRLGFRVLVMDADFGLANVDIMLGLTAKYNLSHLLRGERSMGEIIQTGHEGVRFISGGSGVVELLQMNDSKLRQVMAGLMRLEEPTDVILVDTGAGINDQILEIVLASTQTVVVTTPEPTAVMDAYALIKSVLRRAHYHEIQIVMNKGMSRRELETVTKGFVAVIEKNLEVRVETLGYVSYDSEISRSIKLQTPILINHPERPVAQEISLMAQKLMNVPGKPSAGSRLSSLFSRLFGEG